MSFLNPQALYYMLPPLVILFVLLLTQKESQAHFFAQDVMDKLRVGSNSLTLKARNALFFLMGFFMILALAQPVIDDGVVLVKAKSADIMIALDISDSMLAEDVYPNRLELAKQKALTLLKNAPTERLGILAFAKNSYLVSPLSFDTKAVSFLLTQLDTTSITEKGTNFLSVLDVFSKSSKSKGKKYLLLLSDGGDSSDFSKEIELAKQKNIVVFVLGIGTKKGAPIKLKNGSFIKQNGDIIISKLNENIAKLATSTSGVYIQNTTSSSDIQTMFQEIKNISEAKELKSEEVHKYIPLFYYPLGMALLLLLIATSSLGKRVKGSVSSVLVVLLFSISSVDLKAGMFDFMQLQEAKEAYQQQEYEKSTELYSKYAESSEDPHAYFNAGNAFYKQKKYKEAVKLYEKAIFQKKEYKADKLGNLGNAHAKQGTQENLKKAKKYYEESLKLVDDDEVKNNLEEVKKRIKEEKERSKEDDGDKDSQKEDKNGDNKMDKDSKDGDKNSNKEENNKKDEDSSKSKESKDKNQKNDDMKSKEEQEDSAKKDEAKDKKEQKKEQLDKLDKKDDNKSSSSNSTAQNLEKQKMSDAEEKKWLKHLNSEKNTYLYRLSDQKTMGDIENEKPW